MFKKRILYFVTVCVFLSITPFLWAAGFNLYEMGAKSTGLAGAFSATADDPSAIYYNPAGLVQLDGWNMYVGVTILQPTVKFAGASPYPGYGVEEETKSRLFFPPGLYLSKKVHSKVATGIGVYAPFALATEWDNADTYSGRYISQKAELTGVFISPSISVQAHEMVSVGVNFNFVYSAVELNRVRNQPFNGLVLDVAEIKLEADNGLAFGFDLGVLAKPIPKVQLGLVYRSKVKNEYTGDATFTPIATGNPALDALVAAGLPTSKGKHTIGAASEISFPSQFVLAASYKPIEKLSAEMDFIYFGWSCFDELPFLFSSEKEEGDVNTPDDNIVKEDYENSYEFRLGVEYKVMETFAMRAGYVYDKSPVPTESVSPFLPDSNRNDFSIGFGYKRDKMTVDFGTMVVIFNERSTDGKNRDNYNGTYNSVANVFGLSVGYNF